jgi:hypothetical protein
MSNIIGVILFLRMGYIVGNMGMLTPDGRYASIASTEVGEPLHVRRMNFAYHAFVYLGQHVWFSALLLLMCAGVWQTLGMIGIVFVMSTVTILSTAGICATCRLKKGGLYAIIKQALGTQIGLCLISRCFFKKKSSRRAPGLLLDRCATRPLSKTRAFCRPRIQFSRSRPCPECETSKRKGHSDLP